MNLLFVLSYLIDYAHDYIVSDFSTSGIHFLKLEPSNSLHFENLSCS